jgi:8-oxo-dGTP pyrophosphatase MutT (NUDIX family)
MNPDNLNSATAPLPRVIVIVAALVCRAGRTVLVRKRGTSVFMQPGGKIEPGEEPPAALLRELQEELGLVLNPSELVYLDSVTAPAANEPGWTVQAELFRVHITGEVQPGAEIEEILWINPTAPGPVKLAPLTRDHVFPRWGDSV